MASDNLCRIKVDYFGAIVGVVKRRQEEVVLERDDASVDRMLSVLCERHGQKFQELVARDGKTSPLVTIFVNGECLEATDSLKRLDDGSEVEVSLVNQMSGG
jgi:molybdopterin converting factor small subunit